MDREHIAEIRPGDRVTVAAHRVGDQPRTGAVVEILGEPGDQRCRVLWDDGHETLVYPGTEAIVEPREDRVVS